MEVERGQAVSLRPRRYSEGAPGGGQDARNATGVTEVVNRLKLRTDLFLPEVFLPDVELVALVGQALARDPLVERSDIGVAAVAGVVTLTGEVDTPADRARAEDIASTTVGVVEIKNRLKVLDVVTPWSGASPVNGFPMRDYDWFRPIFSTLAGERRRHPQRHRETEWWNSQVDPAAITVDVRDGVATLTGTVGSWQERDHATEVAYNGGARLVRNELNVDFPLPQE